MAVDAEGIGQSEGDLAPGSAGGGDRGFHRRARLGRVPQIALEIEDRRIGHLGRVNVLRLEPLRRAEESIHRPLRIGGDEDQRSRGGANIAARGDQEIDPEAFHVVAVNIAQFVARHLADEARFQPERSQPRGGVARRSAADLAPRPHHAVQPHRLRFVDQPHRPLGQRLLGKKGVVGIGDHVDNGIADAKHIKAGCGHGGGPVGKGESRGAPSRWRAARQACKPSPQPPC